jgi:predicted O-methyltransferase YrrM
MLPESEITGNKNPLIGIEKIGLWRARDFYASEVEVCEFLGGLVNLLKPELVVETGCYLGDATAEIGKALMKNGFGTLHTCDPYIDKATITTERLAAEKIERVVVHNKTGRDLIKELAKANRSVDMIFLDSGIDTREEELELVWGIMREYGVVAIHDIAPQHKGMNEFWGRITAGAKVYFNTPRGLGLIIK